MKRKLLAVGLGLATALIGTTALAQEAQPGMQGVQASILLGYGFGSIDEGNGQSFNPYGVGLGVRVGYGMSSGLYLGGAFIYHLGASQTVGDLTVKENVFFFGGEVGYDIAAGPVYIRPSALVGFGTAHVGCSASGPYADLECGGFGASQSKLWFAPGATLNYPIGSAFIGVDARYHVLTDVTNGDAFAIYLTGGMRF